MGAAISEQKSINFIMSFQQKKWNTKAVLDLFKFFYIFKFDGLI